MKSLMTILRTAALALAGALTLLCAQGHALELSDLHLPMTRDEADTSLSKDYSYAIMTDGSVRRTWEMEDKEVIVDFDTVTNDAIMIAVIYKKPVAVKKGKEDAHTLAAGKCDEAASWDSPKNRDAKDLIENTYGLKNARRKKMEGEAVLFYETNEQKNRVVRVTAFARKPHSNRWALTTLTRHSAQTAMGNQMGSSAITKMYADEERRKNITPQAEQADSDPAATATEPTAPKITISVSRSTGSTPAPAQPAKPAVNTVATTPTAAAPTVAPTATPQPQQPKDAKTDAYHKATENLAPGERGTMTLLPPPPAWLTAVGVEEPTWWHYLALGFFALLVVVFVLRAISQNAKAAAQRKRFANVVAQAPAAKRKLRR